MFYMFELKQFPIITDFYIAPLDNFIPPLVNRSDILVIVQSGKIDMYLDGKIYPLEKGDMFFVPANHLYYPKEKNAKASVIWYIHFSVTGDIKSLTSDEMKSEIIQKYEILNFELTTREKSILQMHTIYLSNVNSGLKQKTISLLIESFRNYSRCRSIMYNLQLCSILFSLLIEASQANITSIASDLNLNSTSKSSIKIDKAIYYISQHYSEKITLDDICNYCNLSRTQLIRLFKSVLNTTPIKYINNFKLSKAKEMLYYYPDKSISEISSQLGFDNQHYFAKVFQSKFNESPTQYRLRKHQNDS